MPTCSKCQRSVRPGRGVGSKMRKGKRIVYHLICPRRVHPNRDPKYMGFKPHYRGWTLARIAAFTGHCEVSGVPLTIPKEGVDILRRKRLPYAIDHIVPARLAEKSKKSPHAAVNLICLSASEHGKKRAAEDALLKSGDLLTYLQVLTGLSWPMARVHAALKFYEIPHMGGRCFYCEPMEAGLQQ